MKIELKQQLPVKNLFDLSFHSEIDDVTHDLSILDISETEENSDTKDTESNQLYSEIVELLPLVQKELDVSGKVEIIMNFMTFYVFFYTPDLGKGDLNCRFKKMLVMFNETRKKNL